VKQFLVEGILTAGQKRVLSGKDFHYICRVRRARKGDLIEIRDQTSALYRGTVIEINEDSCTIDIGNPIESENRTYSIHLYLCLCKGKKLDLMIRQATEAGADSITLLDSRYSQVKMDRNEKDSGKYDRWNKIIREASQQSGSLINTKLNPLIGFEQLPFIENPSSAGFFCHQEQLGNNRLSEISREKGSEIHLVIGSEGGLSSGEIKILVEKGFSSLFLGRNVLRAETASIFALATIIATMELI